MTDSTFDFPDAETVPYKQLPEGVLFGPYRIVRLLGAGGMGAVYEAVHTQLNKRVAVKTLHPRLVTSEVFRARFVREGLAASKLDHPHVISVSDVGVEAGVPFLVMEFLTGESLYELLQREGSLPAERAVELLIPVCVGVAAAHRAGIVHRDLKPENIFLALNALGQTVPKVLDFGISKLAETPRSHALTASGVLLGTSHYMSPEQAENAKHVDARSDQFTLGVILYECVTGRLPFNAPTVLGQLGMIHAGRFDRPSMHRSDLPPALESVILRAMARDAEGRFPTVDDLARALLPFADPTTRGVWQRVLATAASDSDFAATLVDAVVPGRSHAASSDTLYDASSHPAPQAAPRLHPRVSFAEPVPETVVLPRGLPPAARWAALAVAAIAALALVWTLVRSL